MLAGEDSSLRLVSAKESRHVQEFIAPRPYPRYLLYNREPRLTL